MGSYARLHVQPWVNPLWSALHLLYQNLSHWILHTSLPASGEHRGSRRHRAGEREVRAELVVTVFLGSLKISELLIPQLPQHFMVLMCELRVGKSSETQEKSLLEETRSVMEDGAIQQPCHSNTVLAGRNYF